MTSRQAAHSHTDIRRSHQRFHTEISWLISTTASAFRTTTIPK